MPLVSVVLSFRNEAENIPALVARLAAMFAGEPVDYELIFVNDASTDRSLEILLSERERNPRVKVLNMSRRFGVAEGVLAGMEAARGDAVVYMDADLQDPPEVIPELISRWRAGCGRRAHGPHPPPRRKPVQDVCDADGLPHHPARVGDRAAGRRRRFQAALAPGRRSPAQGSRGRPVSAGTRRLARLPAGVRHVRTRRPARRPHALPILQPESLEDVRAGTDVVLVHADLRVPDARRRPAWSWLPCWR